MYAAQFLRRARSSQSTNVQKERSMDEIPTDDEVLDALRASEDGLTPTALLQALAAEHTPENIIRAIQRVLDRNKVFLSDGAKLVPAPVDEPALAA